MARPVHLHLTQEGGRFDRSDDAALRQLGAITGGETVSLHQLPPRIPVFDIARRYVRFRELDDHGYVQFDFAIGDPELSVELTLPLAAYQEFCRAQAVTYLTREQGDALDVEKTKWRFGAPGIEG